MLISLNKFDRCESKYECDMCKKKISAIERVVLSKAEHFENAKKKWDLCKKCYKKVEKGVENYHKRKEKKNDT
jgi:hypothetical protein